MNPKDRKRIKETLGKNHVCYVLITCAEPTPDGNMQVEMTYEGDALLASYILQGAQIEVNEGEGDQMIRESKILSING